MWNSAWLWVASLCLTLQASKKGVASNSGHPNSNMLVEEGQCVLHLDGCSYNNQPTCWKNYVQSLNTSQLTHEVTLNLIAEDLRKWGCTMCRLGNNHHHSLVFEDAQMLIQWVITHA